MKLFLSPHKFFVPVALVALIALAGAGGRFAVGSGTGWTILAGALFLALNASLAANWPALDQLGAGYGRFVRGGAAFTLLGSAALSAAISAGAHAKLADNPWYSLYDLFLVTRGPAPFVDTNGEPYVVEGAGHSPATVLLTLALAFALFAVAGLTGVAAGLAWKNRASATILVGSACLAGLGAGVLLAATTTTRTVAGDLVAYAPDYSTPGAVGIVLAALALGSAWVLARTPRSNR
ncbi:hypothetical protein [Corynebacterium timonense]|uniref:Uncharacterized protein n=1 Tax=Corynebacterium timonense TaxID=441500 RepID=A0A1H1S7Y5_9CORY|nr:hypothetical protein [Corynebacterium timonense]SDS44077.1 hypothetical protein SAMN04488539_1682 [Corynebacterium timonense]